MNTIIYYLNNILTIFIGLLASLGFAIITILTSPAYLYRLLVILIAKWFRPDFDSILDVQSSVLVNDYFADHNPRSNYVVTLIFKGSISFDEFKSTICKKWPMAKDETTGKPLYKQLQQYPVRWMGFTFWKKASNMFCIDHHCKKLYGMDKQINDEQLTQEAASLLNRPLPKKQSPWQFYIVENYKEPNKDGDHTAVMLVVHHCLTDGYGVLTALMSSFCDHETITELRIPTPPKQTGQLMQNILMWLSFPFRLLEFARITSYQFRSSPWKIPDNKKTWQHICAKSEPIPIQVIKDIKNFFGVSFTSVLMSAISAVLPLVVKREKKVLRNKTTAGIFEIPYGHFDSPSLRLKTMYSVLENATGSIMPYVFPFFGYVAGANVYPVTKLLARNNYFSAALTNFPGMPAQMQVNGRDCIRNDFVTGCYHGDSGAIVSVLSRDQEIVIGITAEKALMTPEEAQTFLKYVEDEINLLSSLVTGKDGKFKQENVSISMV